MGDPNAPPLHAEEILRALDDACVAYVVVGGLAGVAHGAGRVTFDIDVVPKWTNANLTRLAAALRSLESQLRVTGEDEPVSFPIDAAALRRFEVSTWRTRHGDLDVIIGTPTAQRGVLAGYDELAKRAQTRVAFGISILIAGLDDVIESKAALAREPDLAALPELHRLRDRLTVAESDEGQ